MNEVVSAAAAALATLAVLIGGTAIAFTRNVRAGLAPAIELLLAAGLLHLAVADDWRSIAAAAATLTIRSLLLSGVKPIATSTVVVDGDAR
jgi:hypothetical protein